MRALPFALLLAALAPTPRAQYAEGGARLLGLGRAGVALGAEAWGHANPAAWAGLPGPRAGLHASQAFGLAELRLAAATAALPTPLGTAALHGRSYGFAERRETRVAAGLARSLRLSPSRRLDVGLVVGVESAATAGYDAETAPLLGAGLQGDVLPGLRVGVAARNLLGLGLTDEADLRRSAAAVPGVAAGLAYRPSARATVVADADQDLDHGLSVRVGVELVPVPALAVRAGVSTRPTRLAGGLGVRVGGLRADVAVERHDALGLTPAVGLQLGF